MKKYYVLATFEADLGRWCPQFGAYDKADVQFEQEDYRSRYKASELKIVTLPSGDHATLELHMGKLNGTVRTVYAKKGATI